MTKKAKLLLSGSALTSTVLIPLTIVACGSEAETTNSDKNQNQDNEFIKIDSKALANFKTPASATNVSITNANAVSELAKLGIKLTLNSTAEGVKNFIIKSYTLTIVNDESVSITISGTLEKTKLTTSAVTVSGFISGFINEIETSEILPTAPESATGKVLINATGTDATTINNYVSTLTTAQLNALVTTTTTTKAANDAVATDFTLGTLPGTPGTVTAKNGTPVVDARFNTVVNVPVYFETTNSTAAKNEAAIVVVQIPAFQKPSDNYRKKTIATAFGDQNNQRWVNATKFSNKNTLSLGYNATTSNTSVTTDQNSFVQNAIINGVAGVSLGASDSSGAASALAEATKKSVPVVAYDRLITNTGATYNFYSTFNNTKVGELQALALTAGLIGETEPFASVEAMVTKIKTLTSKPNIGAILIAGSPTDNNSKLFYQGAWTVIQAFIQAYSGTTTGTKNGNITTYGSNFWIAGGTTFEKVATTEWLPANARAKLDTTLADINAASKLSELKGVLAPNDNIANDAVVTGLNSAQADLAKKVYITGQDANTSSVDNIKANGGQNMTILKSDFALTAINLTVISWLIQNNAATKKYSDLTTAEQSSLIGYVKVANPNIEFTIDTESFKDSNNKVIATFLLKPQTITTTNVGIYFK